jgi:response regulator of citrate/malate metabolism
MSGSDLGVLVVDDDFRVAGIHAAFVSRMPGFTVLGSAHTAEQAIAKARATRPDIVLMDIYLPDGNGLDVVRSLLAEPDAPGVIVISAARDMASIQAAMQLGAVHYLIKPFSGRALADRLTSFQALRRKVTQLPARADQADVDELFATLHASTSAPRRPAKGHSAPTLEVVLSAVRASTGDISAAEVAEATGISRATAQRYLTYLEERGTVRRQLRYGSAGRPENRYLLRD